MPRPICATIDLAAFAHNLALARRCAGSARVLAVVKADAYGHGLLRVLPAAQRADGLAVLEIEAAVRAREAGFVGRIVLLEGCFDERDLEQAVHLDLTPVLHSAGQIDALARAAIERPIGVMLKLNSGMNRLGLRAAQFRTALAQVEHMAQVRDVILMSHFANADDQRGVAHQLAVFDAAISGSTQPVSLANSAALLRYPQTQRQWVRPGIMLYGATPFADQSAGELGLVPVMSLASRVIAVQTLAPGESVGYGASFTAARPMRIGVVACGYADGYPRHAPSGTPVMVAGQRTGTVGRVSMDMLCVDLTPVPAADVGAEVELWGRAVPVDEVATSSGTVGYELLCALAPRVPVRVRAAAEA
ncbi:MAG: alanine racemase [Betaproteobacteria bacterium]